MALINVVLVAGILACTGARERSSGSRQDDPSSSDSGSPEPVHTVIASATSGGSISPSGELQAEHEDVIGFALAPEDGHMLASVVGTCSGSLEQLNYTTDPIDDDCSVEAVFEELVPEPVPYCSDIPSDLVDVVVCDPDQNLDDWSEGASYWTTDLRIPAETILALPFTSNAEGREGYLEMSNNMPGLQASGMFWHGWFSVVPGGPRVMDTSTCRKHSSNPNPLQIKWNQTEPAEWECHLGTAERTLYFNMEVRCFEELSDICTPGDRYESDYWLGVRGILSD